MRASLTLCDRCGNEHDGSYGSGKFCDFWCAKSFGSLAWRPRKELGLCLNCQGPLPRRNRKYCSTSCQGRFQSDEKIRLWEAGELDGLKIPRAIRLYLIREYGARCWKCGWAEQNSTSGAVPVELNHIDGDWRNYRKENLEIICPNCHALTPNFRALNRRLADRKVKGQRKRWGVV